MALLCVMGAEQPVVIDPPDERAPAVKAPIDNQAVGLGNGIWSSEWFGTYWHDPYGWPWIYHFDAGWVYIDYRSDPDAFYAYFYNGGFWVYYEKTY